MAGADYAEFGDEYGDEPPPELLLAWQVEQWGSVAVFGAREIPANLLRRMSSCLNVYKAFLSYVAGSNNIAKWATANPVYLEIVTMVREIRKNA